MSSIYQGLAFMMLPRVNPLVTVQQRKTT